MKTQILTQPVYVDAQHRTTLCCPRCGKSKDVDVSRHQGAATPPKVKCPCGHKFRVPLASHASRLVRCQTCEGKGHQMVVQEKKVVISEIGYTYTPRFRKEACSVCRGTGLLTTQSKVGRVTRRSAAGQRGLRAFPQALLGFLVARTLGGLDRLMAQRGQHWLTLRATLEMDLDELIKRKTRLRFEH